MNLHNPSADIYIPDDLPLTLALRRTTHLGIAAHQDDLEIMAAAPILDCFQHPEQWFTGVVVADGRGSPRDDLYKQYSDEAMRLVRKKEQQKAAYIGEYAAMVILDYPSQAIKDNQNTQSVEDLTQLLHATHPTTVFTHNLADKHDTHIAVALRVLAALRNLPESARPQKLYGCEVWRDLDWLVDSDKVALNLTARENLQAALLGVFDSQISGGKRYDLATLGRRRANATYLTSHGTDQTLGLSFAMDLTPLIQDANLEIAQFVQEHITRFAFDVADRLRRLG